MSIDDSIKEGEIKSSPSNNYGRPHDWERYVINVDGEGFLPAQHEKKGPWALYRADGSKAFGDGYFEIGSLIYDGKERFLVAQIGSRRNLDTLYRIDGSTVEAYGCPHFYISDFDDLGGEPFLRAHHTDKSLLALYRSDGSFINFDNEPIFDVCVRSMLKPLGLDMKYEGLKDYFGARIPEQAELIQIYSSIKYAAKKILNRHSQDPFEVQKAEVDAMLSTLFDTLKYHPEKFMKELKVVWG